MDGFDKVRKTLTQVMLNRKFLTVEEFKKLVDDVNRKYEYDLSLESDEDLREFIGTVNSSVSSLGMKLCLGQDEQSGEPLILLINILDNDFSRHPLLSEHQLAFFRKIIELIVDTVDGSIDSISAVNSVYDVKNCSLNATQAEQAITELTRQNFLVEATGRISMTPVTRVELQPYLQSIYADKLYKCFVCNAPCFNGTFCPNDASCNAKIHPGCAAKYFAISKKCRLCNTAWEIREMGGIDAS